MKELVVIKETTVLVEKHDVTIVGVLAADNSIAETAKRLRINQRTLEAKIGRIKAKYGCKTLQGLVAYFYNNKLFD